MGLRKDEQEGAACVRGWGWGRYGQSRGVSWTNTLVCRMSEE